MKLTEKQKIFDDAKAAGLIVGERMILKSPKGAGLTFFEDGSAIRCDVDLSVTTSIRSAKVAREVLGI